jgi:hypothetical protein
MLLAFARAKTWPITALELTEVNKPHARISDIHSSPIHSHTCIEVTSGTPALDDLDSCHQSFKITCSRISLYKVLSTL